MATCSVIAYENVLDTGNIAIQSCSPSANVAENTFYPISNINLQEPHRCFKPSESTDTSCVLRLTMGASADVDTFFIIGHPISGLIPTTVTIRTYSDAFVTLQSTDIFTGFNTNEKMGFGQLSATQTTGHIEIELTAAGGNLALCNMFLGQDIGTNRGFPTGFRSGKDDKSKFRTGRYGQKFTDKVSVRPKNMNVKFNNTNQTERLLFDAMFDFVGTTENVYIMADTSEANAEIWGGVYTIRKYPSTTHPTYRLYSYSSIKFEEVI
jgi:hypothetical protein